MNEISNAIKLDAVAGVTINEAPNREEKTLIDNTIEKVKEDATNFKKKAFAGFTAFKQKSSVVVARIRTISKRISRTLWFYLIFAIAINVVATYFWPELPEKVPTIWAICNGTLILMDSFFKIAVEFIKGIVTLSFFDSLREIGNIVHSLWAEFITWITSI